MKGTERVRLEITLLRLYYLFMKLLSSEKDEKKLLEDTIPTFSR